MQLTQKPAEESNLETTEASNVLVVGTAVTKPFEFYAPETDQLIGLDVEIATYLAEQMGVQLVWVEMPFASLIPALQEHKVDMTIAAMYITEEREAQIDFSIPYLNTGLVMVTSAPMAEELKNIQDLNGKTVGVKIGATGAVFAEELLAQGMDITLVQYKDTIDSLMDLEVGRLDVVFNDYLNTLVYLRETESNLVICEDNSGATSFLSNAGLGIGVAKNNQALLNEINSLLTRMKAEGMMDQLLITWLGNPPNS